MQNLAKCVKNECCGIFFNEVHAASDPTFGLNKVNDEFIALCTPYSHYSKLWPCYWFANKAFKEVVAGQNLGHDPLNIFHYPINSRRLKKQAYKREKILRDMGKDVDATNFLKWFKNTYGKASVLHINVFGDSIIVGSQTLMEEVTNAFKKQPNRSLNFLEEITTNRPNVQSIRIYDLINKPKEIHHLLD